MKLIPTTATVVEKVKANAKTIKSAKNVPHLAALEQASTDAGYESWFHIQWCLKQSAQHEKDLSNEAVLYMAYLARKGGVPVITYPAKGNVFHDVEIEGVCFRGVVVGTPVIVRRSARLRGYEQGWVQLGVAEIYHAPLYSPYIAQADQKTPIGRQWWICKYGPREERVKVDDLTPAGRYTLAHEFGLPLHSFDGEPGTLHYSSGVSLFYLSPAFMALCEWVKKHPRKAGNYHSPYLGYWVTAAKAGEEVATDV